MKLGKSIYQKTIGYELSVVPTTFLLFLLDFNWVELA